MDLHRHRLLLQSLQLLLLLGAPCILFMPTLHLHIHPPPSLTLLRQPVLLLPVQQLLPLMLLLMLKPLPSLSTNAVAALVLTLPLLLRSLPMLMAPTHYSCCCSPVSMLTASLMPLSAATCRGAWPSSS